MMMAPTTASGAVPTETEVVLSEIAGAKSPHGDSTSQDDLRYRPRNSRAGGGKSAWPRFIPIHGEWWDWDGPPTKSTDRLRRKARLLP